MFSLVRSLVLSLFVILLLLVSPTTSGQSEPQPAFISDNLVVYLHSGPGNQFRIIGTLTAGTPVFKLAEADNYVQIRFDDNRTGWLLQEHLSFTPGIREQFGILETRFTAQSEQLNLLLQTADEAQGSLQRLTQERDQAQAELALLKVSNERLTKELDAQQASFWQQPMVLGSAILLFGLLFGLILPKLIPQRRNSDRWM